MLSGNQPFYNPEVPPFKLQLDIIDFSDYDNDTDVDDCPLRVGFYWQQNLTNQKPDLNRSKWLSKSRLDKLFSIRLLLLQLQKYFSRWPRHRYPGYGLPDGPNCGTDSTDEFNEPGFKRVIAVDMKNEVFAVSAYNVITWHDDRLEWDPKDRNRLFVDLTRCFFLSSWPSSSSCVHRYYSSKPILLKGL